MIKKVNKMTKPELLVHITEIGKQLTNSRAAKTRYSNKADQLKSSLEKSNKDRDVALIAKLKLQADYDKVDDLYNKVKKSVEDVVLYFKLNMLDSEGKLVSFMWNWRKWVAAVKFVAEQVKAW